MRSGCFFVRKVMMRKLLLIVVLTLLTISVVDAADLIFVDDNSFVEDGYKYVQGVIKNGGVQIIKVVTITVKFYDESGEFLRFAQTFANPAYLLPGHEGFYEVSVPEDPEVKTYTIHADYEME